MAVEDDHIIRVIIQGYDRLSSVAKSAADKAGQSMTGLNDKLKSNRAEASGATIEMRKLATTTGSGGGENGGIRGKVDKLAVSMGRLREEARTKLFVADDITRGLRRGLEM